MGAQLFRQRHANVDGNIHSRLLCRAAKLTKEFRRETDAHLLREFWFWHVDNVTRAADASNIKRARPK